MAHPLSFEDHDRIEAFIQSIPEIIVAAALKKIGGDMIVMHERPARHSASLNAVPNRYDENGDNPWECGFITSRGRFVGREEAGRIVRETGQGTTMDHENNPKGLLFSEDLWIDEMEREILIQHGASRDI